MSFSKARDLVQLAQMAAARRRGVALEDIMDEFAVSHRTAQRMAAALETTFANVQYTDGPDRKRRWRLVDPQSDRLQLSNETGIEALDIAARHARDAGRMRHAKALDDLRAGLLARLPGPNAARVEADAEAVLSSLAEVTRPGPRSLLDSSLLDAMIEALRGPFRLKVFYRDDAKERILEPHGVLLGHRTYLVARDIDKPDGMRSFRMDLITGATVLDESFALDPDFVLSDFAARSFGVWQDPTEYGEVVWRFVPSAAERASGFRFHPRQTMERCADGSLIVRFTASGWLEMAWHLYQWGDLVEVLAPEGLARMVEGHRRSDFGGTP